MWKMDAKTMQTFNVQCISVCGVDDDIVGYVGVQCNLIVLRRCVDVYSASIVSKVIVGNRQQFGVLHVAVYDTDSRVVEHADSRELDVVRLKCHAWIGLSNILKNETASSVSCHRVVSDSLQLTST